MLARLVVIWAKRMNPRVATSRTLLCTICENALMGFAIPVAVEAIAPISPRRTVVGTMAIK